MGEDFTLSAVISFALQGAEILALASAGVSGLSGALGGLGQSQASLSNRMNRLTRDISQLDARMADNTTKIAAFSASAAQGSLSAKDLAESNRLVALNATLAADKEELLASKTELVATQMAATKAATLGVAAAFGAVALAAGSFIVAVAHTSEATSKFNEQMELLHTQAGASQDQVEKLKRSVLDLGPAVGEGPDALAKGLYHVVSIGVPAAQQMEVLRYSAMLARMGLSDMDTTTNALAGTMVSGMKGVQGVADAAAQLNSIVGAGNLHMNELVGAIGTGLLPAAKNAGLSLTMTGAALATLTDLTFPATRAAFGIRTGLAELEHPSREATRAFQQMGITQDQVAQMLQSPAGLLGVMRLLRDSFDKMGATAEQRTQLLGNIFGGGGQRGVAMIALFQNQDRLDQKIQQVTAHTKDFQEQWESTKEQAAFAVSSLQASFQSFEINVGQVLLPMLTAGAEVLRGVLDGFNALPSGVQKGIVVVSLIVAGITALFFGLAAVALVLPSISAGFELMGAMSLAAIPGIASMGSALWTALAPVIPIIALILLGLLAIVAVAYTIYRVWDAIRGHHHLMEHTGDRDAEGNWIANGNRNQAPPQGRVPLGQQLVGHIMVTTDGRVAKDDVMNVIKDVNRGLEGSTVHSS